MKALYLLIGIYVTLVLSSCSTVQSPPASPQAASTAQNCLRDPAAIALYHKGHIPHYSYKVLGKETVSTYNQGGIKRQTAIIHDAMRNIAASMGGDAIIEVKHQDKSVTGIVIAYKSHTWV